MRPSNIWENVLLSSAQQSFQTFSTDESFFFKTSRAFLWVTLIYKLQKTETDAYQITNFLFFLKATKAQSLTSHKTLFLQNSLFQLQNIGALSCSCTISHPALDSSDIIKLKCVVLSCELYDTTVLWWNTLHFWPHLWKKNIMESSGWGLLPKVGSLPPPMTALECEYGEPCSFSHLCRN